MSILIAYKRDDVVYMGTDSRVIIDDYKRTNLTPSMYRIQKMDNDMLVGIYCEEQESQVLFANSDIFTLDKKGKLTRRHIITEIIPKLFFVAAKEDFLKKEDSDFPFIKAVIILAYKDTIYTILPSFTVVKNEGFVIAGGAGGVASATMERTKPTDDINERIVRAMDIASKHAQAVGAPYILIDTQNLNYTVVKEAH